MSPNKSRRCNCTHARSKVLICPIELREPLLNSSDERQFATLWEILTSELQSSSRFSALKLLRMAWKEKIKSSRWTMKITEPKKKKRKWRNAPKRQWNSEGWKLNTNISKLQFYSKLSLAQKGILITNNALYPKRFGLLLSANKRGEMNHKTTGFHRDLVWCASFAMHSIYSGFSSEIFSIPDRRLRTKLLTKCN